MNYKAQDIHNPGSNQNIRGIKGINNQNKSNNNYGGYKDNKNQHKDNRHGSVHDQHGYLSFSNFENYMDDGNDPPSSSQSYQQIPRPQPKPKPIQQIRPQQPQSQPSLHSYSKPKPKPIEPQSHWICEQCSKQNRHIDFFCTVCGFRKGYDPETDPNNNRMRASKQNLQQNRVSSVTFYISNNNIISHNK